MLPDGVRFATKPRVSFGENSRFSPLAGARESAFPCERRSGAQRAFTCAAPRAWRAARREPANGRKRHQLIHAKRIATPAHLAPPLASCGPLRVSAAGTGRSAASVRPPSARPALRSVPKTGGYGISLAG